MARRYARDAKGRFAGKGYAGQTSGRGARLTSKGDTGAGKRISSGTGKPAGTISGTKRGRSSDAVERAIARDTKARSGPKNVIKSGPGTSKLNAQRAAATKNAVRPGPRLGPSNAKNKVVKAPERSAVDKLRSQARSLSKEVKDKGIKEKLSDLNKKASNLRNRMTADDKRRLKKAFDKPSVTDKRSRDYLGRLTKQGKGQDPSTGGKKKRKPRKPKK